MTNFFSNTVQYLLNWMKTRFHISRTSGLSMFTKAEASRSPIRSKWISVQGPHGPTSPISQKLSFIPNGKTRSGGRLLTCRSRNYFLTKNLGYKTKKIWHAQANHTKHILWVSIASRSSVLYSIKVDLFFINYQVYEITITHPTWSQNSFASLSGGRSS